MAKINLLPWREEYREERKKEYLTQLALLGLLVVIICFVWVSSIAGAIEDQRFRNRMLNTELTELNKKVEQIKKLKKDKKELEDRIRVIQDLEGKRSVIVHYFDEFAKRIPDGVYLRSLKRNGEQFAIEGVGESNLRIAALMRNLDASEWFTNPNLKSVNADPKSGEQAQKFTMTLDATLPDNQKEAQDG